MGNTSSRKDGTRVSLQGLHDSGKTSLMYRMKLGKVVPTVPTMGLTGETLKLKDINLTCLDIGVGRDGHYPVFRSAFPGSKGVIYVIDSNNRELLAEAMDDLIENVLLEEKLQDIIVMVIANKQDLPGAMSAQEIEGALKEKYSFSENSKQSVFVLPCSVTNGEGVSEAFDIFIHQLKLKKEGKAVSGLVSQSDLASQMMIKSKDQRNGTFPLKAMLKNPKGCFKSLF